MDRISRYLLSTGNMLGSCAALAVIGLYLLGVIDSGWPLLTAGAYFAGALPFLFKDKPAHMPEGLSTADALLWLRESVMPKLPAQSKAVLADILLRVDGLMPRLKEMEGQGLVEATSRAMLKQTVTRLLPDAVESYLRLPPTYAKVATLGDGKTAQQLLNEQLVMLQDHVRGLEESLLMPDVNTLLANGRFLQEKFQADKSLFQ
ncbi:MAG: hypothetical protein V4582_03540 [Pseudomonadota bacterium]